MKDGNRSPIVPHLISGEELWQWRQQARKEAIATEVPVAELDWLLQALTGLDSLTLRLETFKDKAQIVLKVSFSDLQALWQQRIQARSPVQYLAGTTHWRDFALQVSPAVLIPRPETELLIDLALAAVQRDATLALQAGHWADLGTGSGAIALGLARVFPNATIHAVDLSEAALTVAQTNAQQLGSQQIQFHHGSWFQPLNGFKGQLSGMVSNPPYIPRDLIPTLQPEVAQHEPHSALDGGMDGLDCIRHLVNTAPDYLRSGGVWLIEMMAGQAETVQALLENQGSYHSIQIHQDFAGIDRFALAYRI